MQQLAAALHEDTALHHQRCANTVETYCDLAVGNVNNGGYDGGSDSRADLLSRNSQQKLAPLRSLLTCLSESDTRDLSENDRQELVVARRYIWICSVALALILIVALNLLPHKFSFPIHPSVVLLTVPTAVCIIGAVTGCCLHARVRQRIRRRRRSSYDHSYTLQPMLHRRLPQQATQESLADV